MKLSDYVIKFLEKKTDSIFLLSGGGIMHLVDSVGKSKLKSYCCHHEQAVVTAAEGYARIKNNIGVALVTSGPGGTNAVTGVASAWLDSIPILVIGGQVKCEDITPRKNGILTTRAIGFQELNVIDLVRPITKYAISVTDPNKIRYYLEKAIYLSLSGRPGPVWIEIPLDVQSAKVGKLKGFKKPSVRIPDNKIDLVVKKLEGAKRPLMMVGNGVRLAGGEKILLKLLNKLKINTVTPIITADDLVTYDYPYYLGRQGIPGNESANSAIDKCDLLLIIGERMQLTQTSYDYKNFAPTAFKIMVDIDENEINKKTLNIDIPICTDAKSFLEELYKRDVKLHRWEMKPSFIDPKDYQGDKRFLNVYNFLGVLSQYIGKFNIATANGMASLSTHQALRIYRGQRLITNAGLGQMGSGLPLAIGACIASKSSTVCMEGDGSLMLNIHELQTILYHNLPIKLFIFNNGGYYSIRNTHQKYFNKVFAADSTSGLSLPDYSKLIPAWGMDYECIHNDKELSKLEKISNKGPIVFELMIDPNQPMLPKWSAGDFI